MTTINLERPIVVKRDEVENEVSTLELATPTARHFVTYGSPHIVKSMDADDARPRPVFNDRVVAKFLGDCTGAGEAAIGQLMAPDYLAARWALFVDITSKGTLDDLKTPGKVRLTKPITTHAGTLSELSIATPAARSVIQNGVPFEWRTDENDNAYVVYDDRKCMRYLAEMTGHDPIALEEITAPDWLKIRNKIFAVMNTFVGTSQNPQ